MHMIISTSCVLINRIFFCFMLYGFLLSYTNIIFNGNFLYFLEKQLSTNLIQLTSWMEKIWSMRKHLVAVHGNTKIVPISYNIQFVREKRIQSIKLRKKLKHQIKIIFFKTHLKL